MKINYKTLLFVIISPLFWIKYFFYRKTYPSVRASIETLNILKESKKSLCRFGDGEFNIMCGDSIGFQQNNKHLSLRLRDILKSPSNNCYIGIPDIFSGLSRLNIEASSFWLYRLMKEWNRWRCFIPRNYTYLDSLCTRFYMDLKDKTVSLVLANLWKSLWNDENLIIVEGQYTKMGVGNDLFDNAKSVRRIICPAKDAYDKYDKIKAEICALDHDCLILIALGPTATILAYDLADSGYWAIDSGHLDIEYNWLIKESKTKQAISGKLINELNQTQTEEIDNPEFRKQILVDLSK